MEGQEFLLPSGYPRREIEGGGGKNTRALALDATQKTGDITTLGSKKGRAKHAGKSIFRLCNYNFIAQSHANGEKSAQKCLSSLRIDSKKGGGGSREENKHFFFLF